MTGNLARSCPDDKDCQIAGQWFLRHVKKPKRLDLYPGIDPATMSPASGVVATLRPLATAVFSSGPEVQGLPIVTAIFCCII